MNTVIAAAAAARRPSITTTASSPCLPPEILSKIFLEVDPHTLYTSVRALSHGWKQCVEQRLLASEFESGRWRVGLRVVRKPKMGAEWHGGRSGARGLDAPGARWNEIRRRVEEQVEVDTASTAASASTPTPSQRAATLVDEARHAFAHDIVSRYNALEDELTPVLATDDRELTAPVVHVIPLQFNRYDGKSTTLQFSTPNDKLFALFEREASRLDLDFGIVWRFPGDGQDDEEWGDADPENGWLSRFYCSSFDVRGDQDNSKMTSSRVDLHATPLARRVRRAITLQDDNDAEAGDDSDAEDDEDRQSAHIRRARRAALHEQQQTRPLEWSDKSHEYAALSLSLGTEFFVRRSARANFLLRRLEAEVQADKARQEASRRRKRDRGQRNSRAQSTLSSASTPRRSPSQSHTPSSDAMALHRQLRVAAAAAATSSSSPGSCSRSTTGTSTPSWPAWKAGGSSASYAAIAATPPSERSSFRSSRSSGPRVLRVTPALPQSHDDTTGPSAPLPSVNASGYTSVQHRVPVDGKEAELQSLQDETLTDVGDDSYDTEAPSGGRSRSTSASPSSRGYTSKMAVSSHFSVPRAHFSARIVRLAGKPGPKEWQGGDAWGRLSSRPATLDVDADTIAVWEWCR